MRNLKKMLAAVVAVAMMLSMVAVTSFAADDQNLTLRVVAEKASLKQGQETTLKIYIDKAGVTTESFSALTYSFSYDAAKLKVTAVEDVINGDVTPQYPLGDGEAPDGGGLIAAGAISGANNVDLTQPIQVVKVKAIASVEETTPVAITMTENSIKSTRAQGNFKYTVASDGATVSIVPSFTAEYATPVAKTFEIGTAEADVLAALPATVVVKDSESGSKTADAAVADWTCTGTFDSAVAGTLTYEGVLSVSEESPASLASGLKATATVTIAKITDGITAEVAENAMDIVIKKDGDGNAVAQTAEEVAAAVAAALESKVTLKKGAVSEVVAATFAADKAVTNVGDTATVTVTADASASEKFAPAQPVTTTIAVTVIPDVITDITWALTQEILTPSRELAVKLTYAGADYANAPVTVIAKLNGADEKTLSDIAWVLADDGDNAVDDVATISLGTVKDVYAAAKSGDKLTLTVTVNGSPVQVDVDDQGEAIVEAEFAITADGVAGGITGIPVGGNGGGTVVKPEDPAVDPEDPAVDPEDPAVDPEDPAVDPEVPGVDAPVAGLFEDVPADHWAVDYIKQMKDMGVVSGKTATSFEPDATITRAEFVKMIAVTFGLETGATESAFEDCGADDWYTPYVVAAAEAGYVNGISATAFGANDAISRQDICTILARILGLTEDEFEASFTDIDDIADYALVAVKTLAAAGILNGYEDGTFAPTKSATRAEVCKILSSLLAMVTEEAPEEEAAEEEAVVEEEVVEDEAAEEEAVVEEEATEEAAEEEVVEEEVVDEK